MHVTCRPEEHIEFKAQPVAQPVPPICTEMTQLDFSMEAFEHLEVRTWLTVGK